VTSRLTKRARAGEGGGELGAFGFAAGAGEQDVLFAKRFMAMSSAGGCGTDDGSGGIGEKQTVW
jgi:hypothetical protein